MSKIRVCDVCHMDGTLTETTKYMNVRRRPELRLDYCDGCKPRIPKSFREYVHFTCKTAGMDLTEEQLDIMVKYKNN